MTVKIRNARQYREALNRVDVLEQQSKNSPALHAIRNELLALGEALDRFELSRMVTRDYVVSR